MLPTLIKSAGGRPTGGIMVASPAPRRKRKGRAGKGERNRAA